MAAVTWSFSGYLTGYPSQQLAVLQVDVWLPLILFFLYRAAPERVTAADRGQKNSSRILSSVSLIFAGVALGLALLAGHPQSYLIVGYVSVAYLLFLWVSKERGPKVRSNKVAEEQENRDPETQEHTEITNQQTLNAQSALHKSLPRSIGHSPFTIVAFYVLRFTRYALQIIPPLLTFLLTALALAAIQFIPAIEYTRLSVRAEGAYEKNGRRVTPHRP